MGIKRFSKHLLANRSRVRRAFSPQALARWRRPLGASEATVCRGKSAVCRWRAGFRAPLLRESAARAP